MGLVLSLALLWSTLGAAPAWGWTTCVGSQGEALGAGQGNSGDVPVPAGGVEKGLGAGREVGPVHGSKPGTLKGRETAPGLSSEVLAGLRLQEELDDGAWYGWWERRQDPYLTGLRPHWRTTEGDLPSGWGSAWGGGSGEGSGGVSGGGTRLESGELVPEVSVQRTIIPALLEFLAEGPPAEGERSVLVALARLPADPVQAKRITRLLTEAIGDQSPSIAAAAALALGSRGSQGDAPLLLDLASEGPLARRLRPKGVPFELRSAAALGAGLLAANTGNVDVAAYVTKRLLALALDGRATDAVRVAALIGAGPGAEKTQSGIHGALARDEWVLQLRHLLESHKESALLKGRAAVCLARVATALDKSPKVQQVVDLLMDEVEERRPEALRRGAISGLIHLLCSGAVDLDPPLLSRLMRIASSGALETNGPLLIGLARISATRQAGSVVSSIGEQILERMRRASAPERGWCALALGIQSEELIARGQEPNQEVTRGLNAALKGERSSAVRAALVLACALSQSRPPSETLLEWSERGEERVRAWASFALGATLGPPVQKHLAEQLQAARHAPRRLAVIADALTLQRRGTAVLAGLIREPCCQATTIEAARALGRAGNPLALPSLLALLADKTAGTAERAAAASALGRLGDRRSLRLAFPLAVGVDQAAGLDCLFDQRGTGALQLR